MADFDPNESPVPIGEDTIPRGGPPSITRLHRQPFPQQPSNFFPFRRPGEFVAPTPENYERTGGTPGFGPGMFIPHYLMDWGDCVARIHRKRCHPTILRSFPVAADRRRALTLTHRFTWKGDSHDPPFTAFLIGAPPFVGYTWDAALLLEWLGHAEGVAISLGAPNTLDKAAAMNAALLWTERVIERWHQLTRELFPYAPADVFRFWVKPEVPLNVP